MTPTPPCPLSRLAFVLLLAGTALAPARSQAAVAPLAPRIGVASAHRTTALVDYVIVTDTSLLTEFAPLANAHTLAGLSTMLMPLPTIRLNYPAGVDDAERIRLFLKDAHANWGTRFVLLGGSDALLPMRRVTLHVPVVNGQTTLLLPTDQYFACLDGTWNADGDADWGENADPSSGEPGDDVDFVPELAVGRAPVSTPAEAHVFVQKSIAAMTPSQSLDVLLAAAAIDLQPTAIDMAFLTEPLVPDFTAIAGSHVSRYYELSGSWPGSLPETRSALLNALAQGPDVAAIVGQGGP